MFKNDKKLTVSNLLSLLRLLIAVPLWFLFDNISDPGTRYIILGFAFIAIATDFLDGYFARKYNQVTKFGKIIDPLADKILVGIVIIKLYLIEEIPGYFFFLVIGRDILIFIGGIFLSNKIGKVLPSNMLGKITVSVLALLLLMIIINFDKSSMIYRGIYLITIIMIIVSFIAYLVRAIEFLTKKNNESV